MTVPFITVEGPIGVGKTSLSSAISNMYGFHLLKEIVDENPFLGKFYENIEEWSFQTEMFFLCNRYKQLSDIKNHMIQNKIPVVADYHIFKNLIFAKRTLNQPEYIKYESIYHILISDMPRPNMVVYLHASIDTLVRRINMRGREFEKLIKRDYLEQLAQDYDEFIQQFKVMNPDIPVIQIDGDRFDFVQNKADLQHVLNLIDDNLKELHTK